MQESRHRDDHKHQTGLSGTQRDLSLQHPRPDSGFRPAALQVLRSGFATPGFQVLLVMADPYGCPFLPAFRPDFPGRSVLQAPVTFPGGSVTSFS
jgi:hypothetical protein